MIGSITAAKNLKCIAIKKNQNISLKCKQQDKLGIRYFLFDNEIDDAHLSEVHLNHTNNFQIEGTTPARH